MKLFPALVLCLVAAGSSHAQSVVHADASRESTSAAVVLDSANKLPERPVFMTAQRLAALCKDWLKFPIGYLDESATDYSVSPRQFVRAMGCISYIEGSADTLLQISSNDAEYRPKAGNIPDARDAVGYFVRYMDRHTEDSDLAAITVLRQCEIERAKK